MIEKIVDTHVHFWQPGGDLDYIWLMGTSLERPVLPENLAQESGALPLEKIVFVEAGCPPKQGVQEIEWVLSLNEPKLGAMVAAAPLEQGAAVRAHLEKLAQYPLVKNIRRLIQSEAAGFSTQPGFVEAVKMLPEFGFGFDLCIYHYQMSDVIQLVRQCPDVSFVLDHIGKPDIKNHVLDPWRDELKTLAGFPNVYCKVSGLVTEADHANWTRDDLKPYIGHVLDVFGIDRVMFGGDWAVSTLATTYPGWVETLDWATNHLTADESRKLFHDNAIAYYRIGAS